MGKTTNGIIALMLSKGASNRRRRSNLFGTVNTDNNVLICGGDYNSYNQQSAWLLLEQRLEECHDNFYPTIILSSDTAWSNDMYSEFGNDIAYLGRNVKYDPFIGCVNTEQINFILEHIAESYVRVSKSTVDPSRLLTLCKQFVSILELTYGVESLSLNTFIGIGDMAANADGLLAFCNSLISEGFVISGSVKQALNREWNQSFPVFCDMLDRLKREFSYYSTSSQIYSLSELLEQGNCVLLDIIRVDNSLTMAAVTAELKQMFRLNIPFCFINNNVPLDENFDELFMPRGVDSILFTMYFNSLENMKLPLNNLSGLTDNLVCLGCNNAYDARQLIEAYSDDGFDWVADIGVFGIGAHKAKAPKIQVEDLMRWDPRIRRGVRDGQAYIFDSTVGAVRVRNLIV